MYFAQKADVEGYPDVAAFFRSVAEGETYEYTEMYPGFARTAREEGFPEGADWLETMARAEKSHAGRLTQGLDYVK